MSRLIIEGGRPLEGSVRAGGAKNSVLPILAATIISGGESIIHNCPDLRDVHSAIAILRHLGCRVSQEGHTVTVADLHDDAIKLSAGRKHHRLVRAP